MAKNKKASKKTRAKTTRKKQKSQHPLKKASRLFLPYPIFIFIMLCVGAMLIYSTFKADAIDYTVKAKVPAAALTEPAVITSPSGGSTFTEVPIIVRGTCPLESYVNIYRNEFFSGSTLCTNDKKFEVSTDLFEGSNELKAKVFNLTDDEGPASPSAIVHYNPSGPVGVSGGDPAAAGRPNQSTSNPFMLKADFKLRGYFVGQKISWKIETSGGTPPYAISIDWGDGTSSLYSQKNSGNLTIEHVYKKPGGDKGDYIIKITASDSASNKAYLQLFVIINAEDAAFPIIGSSGSTGNPFSNIIDKFLKFLWPAYLATLLMALSFWLGEREELIILRRRAGRGRRHA